MHKNQNSNLLIERKEIKRSNQLLEAAFSMSLDSFRLFLLGASKLKEQLQAQVETQDSFAIVISKQELQEVYPTFHSDRNIHQRLKKIVDDFKQHNTIALPKEDGEKISWDLIPIINKIEYQYQEHQLTIDFDSGIRAHINPVDNFNLNFVERFAQLSSMYQVKIYDMCNQYPYVSLGKRIIKIEKLKQQLGIDSKQYRQIGHFINRIVKYSIDNINKRTDINLEFKTIRTGRRATDIIFYIQKKGLLIEQKTNTSTDLKKQIKKLLNIDDTRVNRLLTQYSTNLLVQAITILTEHSKTKQINSINAYFIGTLNNLKSKVSGVTQNPYEITKQYMGLLTIEQKQEQFQEFYDQLSSEEKSTYNEANKSNNNITKNALNRLMNQRYGQWIYQNKIKTHNQKKEKK